MKLIFTIFLLLVNLTVNANELKNNHSPYLRLHGDDPVNWRLLDHQLLKEAQKNNQLIFISSGYYSCHWCHVMQKESYKNQEVANFLNKHFISIKIDRELEPALDSYLIDFVTKTRGSAGWPLNVFITPEGHPLLGLTYLPKKAFLKLLTDLQKQWQNENSYLKKIAKASVLEDNQLYTVDPLPQTQLQKQFIKQTLTLIDDFEGGFGNQSKFPMVPNLEVVMQLAFKTNNPTLKDFVQLTLDKMAYSGLRDPLNGGFFRYTVDQSWKTPHFEKMLYDNAQLARLYYNAQKYYPKQAYRKIADNTLDYVIKHMNHPNGGYISSLTADDEQQVEGGFYLWDDSTLKKILTIKEYTFIKQFWYWNTLEETGEHLFYPIQKQPATPATQALLVSAKNKLANYQQQHHRNPKDDKRLTSWNALLLEALSSSNQSLHQNKAKQLYQWIRTNLMQQNKLYHHATHQSQQSNLATLEDYAYLSKALLAYQKIAPINSKTIEHLLTQAWDIFYQDGFWHASQHTFLPGQIGYYEKDDSALASGEATLIVATKRYLKQHKNKALMQYIQQINLRQTNDRQTQPFHYASYLLQ